MRIDTYNVKTAATHEYIYLLTDPKVNGGAVSEITAPSNTKFNNDSDIGIVAVTPAATVSIFVTPKGIYTRH